MGYKPTITKIDAFDANIGTTVNFGWDGINAAKGNRLTIKDSADNIVYYHEITNSFVLQHKMNLEKGKNNDNVNADFVNGNQYHATLAVLDVIGNWSDDSDPTTFYCFTTPEFNIENESFKS